MIESYTIEYETRRCATCGTFWAIEKSRAVNRMDCPRCNALLLQKSINEQIRLERANRALKGFIRRN